MLSEAGRPFRSQVTEMMNPLFAVGGGSAFVLLGQTIDGRRFAIYIVGSPVRLRVSEAGPRRKNAWDITP